jgi:glucose-6-phosphate isomerase
MSTQGDGSEGNVVDPTTTAAWAALRSDAARLEGVELRELFASSTTRADELSFEVCGIHADLSKNLFDAEVLAHLVQLAQETGVEAQRDAMFRGEVINSSERRSVLHVALRMPRESTLELDGHDVVADVHEVLDRMAVFVDAVREGTWRGATGEQITHVVNVGIGGSYLGPEMASKALRRSVSAPLEARFVANVDGADFEIATRGLDPATTLFIISSKTFTTLETMTNARLARAWIVAALGEEAVAHHFVAVSTNAEEVAAFGIRPDSMFGFWSFVGGRYSMDSAIGLSTMLLVGSDGFAEMLAGFHAMDEHFRTAPVAENLPMLLGLSRVWYSGFKGVDSIGVMPYAADLARLPAYLQQLEMESNGKRVRRDGAPVGYDTGLLFWGEPGTDGQHSFYQLLHQGTRLVPLDLIGVLEPLSDLPASHDLLMANLFAQAASLAFGRTAEEVAAAGVEAFQVPFRTFPGNRPSTLLLLEELSAFSLGALIALYEHEVFTQGAVWGIDSFDQWGVELGKQLALEVAGDLTDPDAPLSHDASTNHAIALYRSRRRDRS